jgi:hypothetical protein
MSQNNPNTEQNQSQANPLRVLRGALSLELVLLVRDSAGRHFEITVDNKGQHTVEDFDTPTDSGRTLAEISLSEPGYPNGCIGSDFQGEPIPQWGGGTEKKPIPLQGNNHNVEIVLEVPARFYRIVREVAHVRGMKIRELILDDFMPGLEHDLEVNESLAYRFGFEGDPEITEHLCELAGLKD